VENEYYAKYRCLSVIKHISVPINNVFSATMASRSGQSSYISYNLSSEDDKCLLQKNVAETTPRQSDRTACLVTAARLYLNPPPQLPQNWGQIDPNFNDYHSDPIEISCTSWIPDITNWWHLQEETHSQYADFSNVVPDIFSFIRHGVGVEASCSFRCDVIS